MFGWLVVLGYVMLILLLYLLGYLFLLWLGCVGADADWFGLFVVMYFVILGFSWGFPVRSRVVLMIDFVVLHSRLWCLLFVLVYLGVWCFDCVICRFVCFSVGFIACVW